MKQQTFLSYSRKDKILGLLIKTKLEIQEVDIWFDIEDLAIGDNWKAKAHKAIQQCQNFIYLCSEHSISSKNCSWELEKAVEANKRILPVVLSGFKGIGSLSPIIRDLNFLVIDPLDLDSKIDKLSQAIKAPWGITLGNEEDFYVQSKDSVYALTLSKYSLGRCKPDSCLETGFIRVTEARASRDHGKLQKMHDRWFFVDNGSKNGSYLNNEKVIPGNAYPLQHNNVLSLSGYELLFRKITPDSDKGCSRVDVCKVTSW